MHLWWWKSPFVSVASFHPRNPILQFFKETSNKKLSVLMSASRVSLWEGSGAPGRYFKQTFVLEWEPTEWRRSWVCGTCLVNSVNYFRMFLRTGAWSLLVVNFNLSCKESGLFYEPSLLRLCPRVDPVSPYPNACPGVLSSFDANRSFLCVGLSSSVFCCCNWRSQTA